MTRKSKPAAQAADAVLEARGTLGEWETTKAAAEAELARLQSLAGSEVLDDPGAAERLPKLMQEQRDRADIAGRVIATQRVRVTRAESDYLAAEADALQPEVDAKRAELQRHNERTDALLAELAKHEGVFVPERDLLEEQASNVRSHEGVPNWSRDLAKSEVLAQEIADADLPIQILRAMADGRDPAAVIQAEGGLWGQQRPDAEIYPACVWGPGALVPAAAYLRSVEAQRAADQQRQTAAEAIRRHVEELEAAIAHGDTASSTRQDWTLGQAQSLPEQLEGARRALAEITSATN